MERGKYFYYDSEGRKVKVKKSEVVPNDNAMGNVPKIIANVVIKMGRKRDDAAASTASRTDIPSSLR